MKHYETLMLLPVTATPADLAMIEKQFKSLTKAAHGNVGTFDKWGRYKLAYPIRKQDYGVYVLARYEIADEAHPFFQKVEHFLKVKCVDSVMRYVHVSLTAEQYAAAYIKPEAMEAGQPGREYRPRTSFAPQAAEAPAEVAAVVAEETVEAVVESTIEG